MGKIYKVWMWSSVVPSDELIMGWDLGGAHLKVALVDSAGSLLRVETLPTPLWRGLDQLQKSIDRLQANFPMHRAQHAVTMTGELVDLFSHRSEGVRQLVTLMRDCLSGSLIKFFAGPIGFLDAEQAVGRATEVASANWYATATLAASELGEGLLVDVGSTTTDILRFVDYSLMHRGYSDGERQASDELIYTGVVRTPLMALAQRVPFAGEWVGIAAEHFATTADIYRLTGELPANADLLETADGGEKTQLASARRLARMIGRDQDEFDDQYWDRLAAYLSEQQLQLITDGCARQLSLGLDEQAPLVGAGVGRFLVQRLAARLGHPYIDINRLITTTTTTKGKVSAADCAPAVAVALLMRGTADGAADRSTLSAE